MNINKFQRKHVQTTAMYNSVVWLTVTEVMLLFT